MIIPLSGTKHRRRIYLMRHGEVSYFNTDGTPVKEPNLVKLTSEGREQANLMRKMLNGVHFDRAVHSGLTRTKETLQRVLGDQKVVIEKVPELIEVQPKSYISIPESRRETELVYAFENAHQEGASYGNGELFTDFSKRILQAFNMFLKRDDWSSLLIVAHDGVNRILLSIATSNCFNDSKSALKNMGGFDQDPCCLNIIDVDVVHKKAELARVKALNLTPKNLIKQENHLSSMEQIFKPYAMTYVS